MSSASAVNGTVDGVVPSAVALLCGLQFPVEDSMQERTMAATEIARQAVKHSLILKMCSRVHDQSVEIALASLAALM